MQELFPLAKPDIANKSDWASIAHDKALTCSWKLNQAFSKTGKETRLPLTEFDSWTEEHSL